MKPNPKTHSPSRKLQSFSDSEDFEGVIARLLPTHQTFSEALWEVGMPLRALMDAINPLDFTQPALPAIKEVLSIYLDQLDYLLRRPSEPLGK